MKDHLIFVGKVLHVNKSEPALIRELIEKEGERAVLAFSSVPEYYRQKFILANPEAYFLLIAQDTLHRIAAPYSTNDAPPNSSSPFFRELGVSSHASNVFKENQFRKYKLEDDNTQEIREQALRRATGAGNLEDVLYFSTLVENINSQDNGIKKQTALHIAVKRNFTDCFEFLGALGARWDIPDAGGETAEGLIRNSKNSALLKVFAKLGQERKLQEPEAENWLQDLIFIGKIMTLAKSAPREAIKIIQDKGESSVNSFKNTHLAFVSMLASINIDVFGALADQDPQRNLGLLFSANIGSILYDMTLQIERVVDTYETFSESFLDEKEKYEVMFRRAAAANDIGATISLMALRVLNIDAQDSKPDRRKTALHWAIIKNGKECARLLIGAGAKTDIPDALGKTAEDYARESGQEALLGLFENKPSRTAFSAR